MQLFQKRKWVYTFTGMCLFAAAASVYWTFREVPQEIQEAAKAEKLNDIRTVLAEQIGPAILHNQWPQEVEIPTFTDKIKGRVEYTLDPDLQKQAEKLQARLWRDRHDGCRYR